MTVFLLYETYWDHPRQNRGELQIDGGVCNNIGTTNPYHYYWSNFGHHVPIGTSHKRLPGPTYYYFINANYQFKVMEL